MNEDSDFIIAVYNGWDDVVEELLQNKNINLYESCSRGRNALQWALERGYNKITELLFPRYNKTSKIYALENILNKGNINSIVLLRILTYFYDENGNTPEKVKNILQNMFLKHIADLKWPYFYILLENGLVDVNYIDKNGYTPIIFLVKNKPHQESSKYYDRMNTLFTDPNINLEIFDKNGNTFLHYAVIYKMNEYIINCIYQGISVDILYESNIKIVNKKSMFDSFMNNNRIIVNTSNETKNIINNWYSYLPSWSQTNNRVYPIQIRDKIKTWILICLRYDLKNKISKDIMYMICEWISVAELNLLSDYCSGRPITKNNSNILNNDCLFCYF